jgi:colicin import membrane protein
MAALETETCRFPGCERPVEAAAETVGRPPRYCELPEHNAQTAFRERRRRAAAGELEGDDPDRGGGERPVSLAIASIGSLAKRLADDMARTRELLAVLTDTEQLEAELAAVRADAQAEVSSAAQLEAAARRGRLEATEAAEVALTAAAGAQAAEQAEDAERRSQDAIARAEAAVAAQAAAESAARGAEQRAAGELARAEQAQQTRDSAIERARAAEHERDQASGQAREAEERASAAGREAARAAKDAERSDKLAHEADQRATSAEQRADAAGQRAERIEERAREDRATLERQLGDERAGRQAAELQHGQAQTALQGEQQLRTQLENDLAQTQHRLEAAEKARDAAIKSLEQAAVRGTGSTSRRTPRS